MKAPTATPFRAPLSTVISALHDLRRQADELGCDCQAYAELHPGPGAQFLARSTHDATCPVVRGCWS